ncbi:hypothetical protein AAG906_013691 [Vitis piasezkii]
MLSGLGLGSQSGFTSLDQSRGEIDSWVVTVDQFTIAMASIQEASASPRQEIDSQQSRQFVVQDETPCDSLPHLPPPLGSTVPAPPYMLHGHFELRLFGSSSTWDDLDSIPVASPLAKFRMPDIESTVMRAHGLDRSQMITMFPLSLSGVSRRELEGLRQRSDEFISSFISHRQGKIAEIVDRPLQRDDSVLMVIRGLIRDPRGKFRPNWSGPYCIRELTLEGVAWLMDLDGNRFSEPTNVDQLKRYYDSHIISTIYLMDIALEILGLRRSSRQREFVCYLSAWECAHLLLISYFGFICSCSGYRPISGSMLTCIIITHITFCFICLLIDIIFTLGILSLVFFHFYHPIALAYVTSLWRCLTWCHLTFDLLYLWCHTGGISPFIWSPETFPARSALPDAWMPSCLSIWKFTDLHGVARSSLLTRYTLTRCFLRGASRELPVRLHFAMLRYHHAFLRDAFDLWVDSVVHVDDLDRAFDDG